MRRLILIFLSVLYLGWGAFASEAEYGNDDTEQVTSTEEVHDHDAHEGHTDHAHVDGHTDAHGEHAEHASAHSEPAPWSVIPFIALLLMIATGPLFFAHFWHHHYPKVAVGLGVVVVGYYLFVLGDNGHPVHALMEYIQFIALLFGLFMAAGGILIQVDKKGKPLTNVILLIIGAILSNVIGTTGASMLLIRPFIRLNKGRVKAYHVMFFIFMVSNVGGSLTPIGDPPLFLGFLKGVPFAWTAAHNIVPWAFAISILAMVFFVFDSKNKEEDTEAPEYSGKITIKGSQNFLWILVVIGAVFIDPNVFDWVPGIPDGHGGKFSFIREIIMVSVGCLSFYFADKDALKGNEFEFEPIKEVAFIFIGIFFTMMPALQLVSAFAASEEGRALINTSSLYWLTGALSGVLDNAPTYLNFLTAAISAQGGSIANVADVKSFAAGTGVFAEHGTSIVWLTAISVASVFFGAMTYIGNAPNFMVKSIAEQCGVEMPSFFGYIVKFSLVILLPVLFLTWLVFFKLDCISLFI